MAGNQTKRLGKVRDEWGGEETVGEGEGNGKRGSRIEGEQIVWNANGTEKKGKGKDIDGGKVKTRESRKGKGKPGRTKRKENKKRNKQGK